MNSVQFGNSLQNTPLPRQSTAVTFGSGSTVPSTEAQGDKVELSTSQQASQQENTASGVSIKDKFKGGLKAAKTPLIFTALMGAVAAGLTASVVGAPLFWVPLIPGAATGLLGLYKFLKGFKGARNEAQVPAQPATPASDPSKTEEVKEDTTSTVEAGQATEKKPTQTNASTQTQAASSKIRLYELRKAIQAEVAEKLNQPDLANSEALKKILNATLVQAANAAAEGTGVTVKQLSNSIDPALADQIKSTLLSEEGLQTLQKHLAEAQ